MFNKVLHEIASVNAAELKQKLCLDKGSSNRHKSQSLSLACWSSQAAFSSNNNWTTGKVQVVLRTVDVLMLTMAPAGFLLILFNLKTMLIANTLPVFVKKVQCMVFQMLLMRGCIESQAGAQ